MKVGSTISIKASNPYPPMAKVFLQLTFGLIL